MMKHHRTPKSYLASPKSVLRDVRSHAEVLRRLEKKLCGVIPAPASEHFVVMNIRNGELIIGAHSPVWAEHLRYHAPQIQSWISNERAVPAVNKVTIRTLPLTVQKKAPRFRRELSRESAELLQQAANTITDPELKKSLRKLANRSRTRT